VSDEVFRHFGLDGGPLPSILDSSEEAVALGDMTKAFGLGGLRIGWIACRDDTVLERALRARDYTTNSNSAVSEQLALIALSVAGAMLRPALETALATRTAIDEFIEASGGALRWCAPLGGNCGWIELTQPTATSVLEICARLAEERHLLFLPGVTFGRKWHRHLRVGLAPGGTELVAGLEAFLETATSPDSSL
jgi:aspartate/methionine/tyrosine aminotransferase